MSTHCPHAPVKKLIVVRYCTYHTLHSMDTTRCSFALFTPMLVLAVLAINHLPAGCELWLAFGNGKSFRYLAAHQIAASLRPEMSGDLPMFSALTGCDTVSIFAGYGKKTAWSTWKSLPELTDALLMHGDGPQEIPDGAVNVIERFVILLFDRTSTCTKVAHARRNLFPRKQTWCSKSRLPELLKRSMSRDQSIRVVTSGGRHYYETRCCHHPLTGVGDDRRNISAPLGYIATSFKIMQKAQQVQEGCTPVHRPLLL